MKALAFKSARLLGLLPIAALVLFYFLTSPTSGNFWWYDSSRHAMNGVFLRDFLAEGGLLDPVHFASQYYEKYPAINIGFYPPFFYITSVPMLLLFGTSHQVSQSVVALYALGLGALVWRISRRTMDRLTATATSVALLSLAPVALWSRQVQLDVPAASIYFLAAYALIRHRETRHQGWMFGAALAVGLGMLTRVQGVFMVPVLLAFLFGPDYAGRPGLARRLLALVLTGVVALPSVVGLLYFQALNFKQVTATPGTPALWSLDNWVWYATRLPEQMGWPSVALIIVALLPTAWLAWERRLPVSLSVLLASSVSGWLFFSFVSNKDPRFNLPSALFLFVMAANAGYLLAPRTARLVLISLAAWLLFQLSTLNPVPEVNGFREAVALTQRITPQHANVLISAHRDGSFIYDMRTLGTRRDIGVRRADKLFVEMHISRDFGIRDRHLDKAAILAILDQAGVATVVMQAGYLDDQASMRNFASLLQDTKYYEKISAVPLSGSTDRDESVLLVYRRATPPAQARAASR